MFLNRAALFITTTFLFHFAQAGVVVLPRPPIALSKLLHRIVHNGQPVKMNEDSWRFTVKVLDGEKICTGVLITTKHALTAGHCVEQMSPKIVEFYQGSSLVGAQRTVVAAFLHPDYFAEQENSKNDLAILEFAGGFPTEEYKAIQISENIEDVNYYTQLFVAGFGLTDPDNYGTLTFGVGHLVNKEKHGFGFDDGVNIYPCSGDSGGPAYYYLNKVPLLIGIAATGYGPCDSSGGGGWYTAPSFYLPWIRSVMSAP